MSTCGPSCGQKRCYLGTSICLHSTTKNFPFSITPSTPHLSSMHLAYSPPALPIISPFRTILLSVSVFLTFTLFLPQDFLLVDVCTIRPKQASPSWYCPSSTLSLSPSIHSCHLYATPEMLRIHTLYPPLLFLSTPTHIMHPSISSYNALLSLTASLLICIPVTPMYHNFI